jgi:hypothetical protein
MLLRLPVDGPAMAEMRRLLRLPALDEEVEADEEGPERTRLRRLAWRTGEVGAEGPLRVKERRPPRLVASEAVGEGEVAVVDMERVRRPARGPEGVIMGKAIGLSSSDGEGMSEVVP